MTTTLEIIRAISQAASKKYHGALDEEGNPVEIGLKRESEDMPMMDGFSVRLAADKLIMSYHSETRLKEVHNKDFETDVLQSVESAVSYLKKEFKKITGDELSLSKVGEPKVLVQSMSRIRSWVTAECVYKVGNYGDDGPVEPGSERGYDDKEITRRFLDLAKK